MNTKDFTFDLPPERIAQQAIEPRDHARLLHTKPNATADHHIYDLPDLLQSGDLLVMNDTRVIPARLYGTRTNSRGAEAKIEIMLHKKHGVSQWLCFAKPGKKLQIGDTVFFADHFSAHILEKHEGGEILIQFNAADDELLPLLQQYGEPPLPPYIKRATGEAKADSARYQTVYAAKDGAVAAPTAGLHFTPELLAKLKAKNIAHATVTLHVGAGTFLPVKVDAVKDHKMHAEYGEINAATAATINKAKAEGRRIVSIGTTSLRVLESATDESGIVHPFARDTAIFITPGYTFRAVDVLLTNFHLPESTLFMLVSAFMGLDRMRAAYKYAIENHYRFYSFGDATLLEKQ